MKKLLLLFAISGQLALAQRVEVTNITQLEASGKSGLYHPVFSPTGEYLLATGENYAGLKLYSLKDKTLKTLTTDPGAGYGVQVSADGNTIAYRKHEFNRNLKSTSLISYSRTSGKHTRLVAPTREALAHRFAANNLQYVSGKKITRQTVTTTATAPVICIEDRKMVLYNGSTRKVLTPNGADASYIWPAISPDNKHIVYTVAGKGTFVCRIDGTNPISLGKLGAPAWINNQWLVGMDDKDDGEKLISSVLVAVHINGKVRQILQTPEGKMALYPAVAADGSRIAFNTEKGELFLMDIRIK